jgi:hypothetical protein
MAAKKSTLRFEDFVRGVEHLRPDEQLSLIEIMSASLKKRLKQKKAKHSVMELEGLGANIWKQIDAQKYIRKERESWD